MSIEDGCAEDDWAGWKLLTETIGAQGPTWSATICSSPIPSGCGVGIGVGSANAILIKVNQIGTLSETLEAVEIAHRAGWNAVMSHRSGETEDATIADLAVATNCGQIKTGSLARSDRTSKYNQLIRIEQQLGACAEVCGIRRSSTVGLIALGVVTGRAVSPTCGVQLHIDIGLECWW